MPVCLKIGWDGGIRSRRMGQIVQFYSIYNAHKAAPSEETVGGSSQAQADLPGASMPMQSLKSTETTLGILNTQNGSARWRTLKVPSKSFDIQCVQRSYCKSLSTCLPLALITALQASS